MNPIKDLQDDLRRFLQDRTLTLREAPKPLKKQNRGTFVLQHGDDPCFTVKSIAPDSAERVFARLKHIYDETETIPKPVAVYRPAPGECLLIQEYVQGELLAEVGWNDEISDLFGETVRRFHSCSLPDMDLPRLTRTEYQRELRIRTAFYHPTEPYRKEKTVILKELQRLFPFESGFPGYMHTDIHLWNVIFQEQRIVLIDEDQSAPGDPMRDFVYAAALHPSSQDARWESFLRCFPEQFQQDSFWQTIKMYSLMKTLHIMENDEKNLHTAVDHEKYWGSLYHSYGSGLKSLVPLWLSGKR